MPRTLPVASRVHKQDSGPTAIIGLLLTSIFSAAGGAEDLSVVPSAHADSDSFS